VLLAHFPQLSFVGVTMVFVFADVGESVAPTRSGLPIYRASSGEKSGVRAEFDRTAPDRLLLALGVCWAKPMMRIRIQRQQFSLQDNFYKTVSSQQTKGSKWFTQLCAPVVGRKR
jgi:hypothetical protein